MKGTGKASTLVLILVILASGLYAIDRRLSSLPPTLLTSESELKKLLKEEPKLTLRQPFVLVAEDVQTFRDLLVKAGFGWSGGTIQTLWASLQGPGPQLKQIFFTELNNQRANCQPSPYATFVLACPYAVGLTYQVRGIRVKWTGLIRSELETEVEYRFLEQPDLALFLEGARVLLRRAEEWGRIYGIYLSPGSDAVKVDPPPQGRIKVKFQRGFLEEWRYVSWSWAE